MGSHHNYTEMAQIKSDALLSPRNVRVERLWQRPSRLQNKNIYYLALYRKSLPTPELNLRSHYFGLTGPTRFARDASVVTYITPLYSVSVAEVPLLLLENTEKSLCLRTFAPGSVPTLHPLSLHA